MARSNQDIRPAVQRALDAFEAFEGRLMAVHAPEFTAVDLTMAQAKLLYVVIVNGDLSMSEIAGRLGVTISTASGAVDHLVSLGLLNRADDPANRRQVRVSVTPFGRQTLEQMRELNTGQLRAMFDLVGDADLEVIERAIRILTDAMASATTDATAAASSRSHHP